MSFRRQIAPLTPLEGEALDRAMAGIGMSFAVKKPTIHLAIEDVLFEASRLGMEKDDFRVLNVLCKWIDVHAARINVDRLQASWKPAPSMNARRRSGQPSDSGSAPTGGSRDWLRSGVRVIASTFSTAPSFRSNAKGESTRGL